MTKLKVAAIGICTGFLNGLFGAGGGTVIVFALQKFLKVETHKSHATAVAIIWPLSIVSAFVYIQGDNLDWTNALYACIGGAIGGGIGAKLLNKIPAKWLHGIFGGFIVVAATRMIL